MNAQARRPLPLAVRRIVALVVAISVAFGALTVASSQHEAAAQSSVTSISDTGVNTTAAESPLLRAPAAAPGFNPASFLNSELDIGGFNIPLPAAILAVLAVLGGIFGLVFGASGGSSGSGTPRPGGPTDPESEDITVNPLADDLSVDDAVELFSADGEIVPVGGHTLTEAQVAEFGIVEGRIFSVAPSAASADMPLLLKVSSVAEEADGTVSVETTLAAITEVITETDGLVALDAYPVDGVVVAGEGVTVTSSPTDLLPAKSSLHSQRFEAKASYTRSFKGEGDDPDVDLKLAADIALTPELELDIDGPSGTDPLGDLNRLGLGVKPEVTLDAAFSTKDPLGIGSLKVSDIVNKSLKASGQKELQSECRPKRSGLTKTLFSSPDKDFLIPVGPITLWMSVDLCVDINLDGEVNSALSWTPTLTHTGAKSGIYWDSARPDRLQNYDQEGTTEFSAPLELSGTAKAYVKAIPSVNLSLYEYANVATEPTAGLSATLESSANSDEGVTPLACTLKLDFVAVVQAYFGMENVENEYDSRLERWRNTLTVHGIKDAVARTASRVLPKLKLPKLEFPLFSAERSCLPEEEPEENDGEVSEELQARMLNMDIPPVCDHPAGRLVNGEYKNPTPNYGGAWLVRDADGAPQAVQGDFNGDGTQELVVAISCYMGGVGWPTNVVVYDLDLNPLSQHGIDDFGMPEGSNQSRSGLREISTKDDTIVLNFLWKRSLDFGFYSAGEAVGQYVLDDNYELVAVNGPAPLSDNGPSNEHSSWDLPWPAYDGSLGQSVS